MNEERDPITVFETDMSAYLNQAVEQRKVEAGLELQNSSTSDSDPISLIDKAKDLVKIQGRFENEIELIERKVHLFSLALREDLERLGVLSPIKQTAPELDKTESKLQITPIEVLGLNSRTYNLLKRNMVRDGEQYAQGIPIYYVEQLLGMSEDDFLRIKGFGIGGFQHVVDQLKSHGFLPADFDEPFEHTPSRETPPEADQLESHNSRL